MRSPALKIAMHKCLLPCLAFAISLFPAPAAAQLALEGPTFAETQDWRITTEGLGCVLSNRPDADEAELWVLRTPSATDDISIRLPQPLNPSSSSEPVVIRMGDFVQTMDVTFARQRLVTPRLEEGFMDAFRASDMLEIVHGDTVLHTIPVAGTAEGHAVLLDCARLLPGGPFRPAPAPPLSPRAMPTDGTSALPPLLPLELRQREPYAAQAAPDPRANEPRNNRPVRPVDLKEWYFNSRPTDLPGGTLVFEVTVDGLGQAGQCRIVESSGVARLDDYACQMLLERARFSSATDGEGNPVASTYRNRMTWRDPPAD